MQPYLRVNGLTYAYAHHPLIQDLSFEVSGSRGVWVQGPNGSGKTTLLHLIAGLLPISQKMISRLGEIHFVPTYPVFAPQITLGTYVGLLEGVLPHVTKISLTSAIDLLGFSHQKETTYESFSAGQKQRWVWIPLLVHFRHIWLLDEPLNHLDDHSVVILETMLRHHIAAGGMVIYTSHRNFPIHAQIVNLGKSES